MMRQLGTGQYVETITSCPHCSFLSNGTCVVCTDDTSYHPSCKHCIDGEHHPPAPAFWQTATFKTMAAMVGVSLLSAILLGAVRKTDWGKKIL